MTKTELIESIATKTETSKAEAKRILETITDTLVEGLKESGEVSLPGIGKLVVVETAARQGVSKIGGVEKAWSKPAGRTIKLRLSKEGKSLF